MDDRRIPLERADAEALMYALDDADRLFGHPRSEQLLGLFARLRDNLCALDDGAPADLSVSVDDALILWAIFDPEWLHELAESRFGARVVPLVRRFRPLVLFDPVPPISPPVTPLTPRPASSEPGRAFIGESVQAPQVGLEPTTLRLTVGGDAPSTDAPHTADFASDCHGLPWNADRSPGESPGLTPFRHPFGGWLVVLVAVLLAACESERTIPTRAKPDGESIPCVGITGAGKRPGIEYNLSAWNIVVGVFFFELLAPPVFVLVDETFCPIADTSRVVRP